MSPLHPQVTRRGGVYLQPGGDTNPGPRAGTPPGCKWSTDPVTAFKVLWPSLESQLTDKYSKDTYSILCLDRWASTWTNLNCTQSMQDIFKALGWPSDLLKNSTYVECVGPLTADELKALTTPFPETTTVPKASTIANNCVWDLGDWVVVHPIIHICDFVTQLLQGVLAQPLGVAFQQVSAQTGTFLWSTPADLTYNNPALFRFWNISVGIVTLLLVVALSWVALRSMVRTTSWLSYANVVEFLPRLLFGVLAAYASWALVRLVIDGSNAFSAVFTSDLLTKLSQSPSDNPVVVILQVLYLILALLLVVEEAARFVVLYILIGFAPLWAFAVSLRETQGIAKGGLQGLLVFALLQPVQNALLDMGQSVMGTLAGGSLNGSILQFLIAIGILILVLSLIFVAARTVLGGIAAPLAALALGGTTGLIAKSARAVRQRPLSRATPSFRPLTPIRQAANLAGHTGRAVFSAGRFVGRYAGNAAFTISRATAYAFSPTPPPINKLRHVRKTSH